MRWLVRFLIGDAGWVVLLIWLIGSTAVAILAVRRWAIDVTCPERMTPEACGRYQGQNTDLSTLALIFVAWSVAVVSVPFLVRRIRR